MWYTIHTYPRLNNSNSRLVKLVNPIGVSNSGDSIPVVLNNRHQTVDLSSSIALRSLKLNFNISFDDIASTATCSNLNIVSALARVVVPCVLLVSLVMYLLLMDTKDSILMYYWLMIDCYGRKMTTIPLAVVLESNFSKHLRQKDCCCCCWCDCGFGHRTKKILDAMMMIDYRYHRRQYNSTDRCLSHHWHHSRTRCPFYWICVCGGGGGRGVTEICKF